MTDQIFTNEPTYCKTNIKLLRESIAMQYYLNVSVNFS